MLKKLIFILLILFISCKTTAVKTPAKATAVKPAPSTNPMSCGIQGKIISITKAFDTDTLSICSKYPCKAKVRIMAVPECGSAVSQVLIPGDTVEMRFMYSLSDTKKIFPYMKAHYPGLTEGQLFTATAEQRLAPGTNGVFVIFGYELQ
jgi:hypothetical protein